MKQFANYSKYLGAKFFRYDEEGNGIIGRVISFISTDIARFKEESGKEIKIPFTELLRDYTLLNPDAYVFLAIAALYSKVPDYAKIEAETKQTKILDKKRELGCLAKRFVDEKPKKKETPTKTKVINDVIVTAYTKAQIDSNDAIPSVVCRQCINDLHSNMINQNGEKEVGCCMTPETCPEGTDFMIMRACDDVVHIISIAVYNTDSLDDILSCIRKIDLYDNAMMVMFKEAVSKIQIPFLKEKALKEDSYIGWNKTLRGLLEDNDFMYDLKRVFGIEKFNIKDFSKCFIDGDPNADGAVFNNETINLLQEKYCFEILNSIVLTYDKDIDLKKVTKDHFLICDETNNIYLVIFTKGRSFIDNIDGSTPSKKLESIFMGTTN